VARLSDERIRRGREFELLGKDIQKSSRDKRRFRTGRNSKKVMAVICSQTKNWMMSNKFVLDFLKSRLKPGLCDTYMNTCLLRQSKPTHTARETHVEAGEVKLADDDLQLADKKRQVECRQSGAVGDVNQQNVVKHAEERQRVAARRRVHHLGSEQLHNEPLRVDEIR